MARDGGALLPKILLGVVATVIALFLCEAIARLVLPWPPPSMIRFQELHVVSEGAGIGGRVDALFVRDPDVFWRLRPDTRMPSGSPMFGTIANAQGLREEREIEQPKPKKQVRLLFLGDSTTFGWGLPASDTQARIVETELERRFPATSIRTVNTAVPGYTAYQGLRVLETRAAAFEPDLVVAAFGFNDGENWGGRGDLEVAAHLDAAEPPAWLGDLRLGRLFWSSLHPLPPVGSPDRRRLTPSEFRQVLTRMQRAATAQGVDLVLLVGALRINVDGSRPESFRTPYQLEQYAFGRLHHFGPRDQQAVIDTVPAMQALARDHTVDEIFLDHVHPTKLGNEVVARLVVERLAPWVQTKIRY